MRNFTHVQTSASVFKPVWMVTLKDEDTKEYHKVGVCVDDERLDCFSAFYVACEILKEDN